MPIYEFLCEKCGKTTERFVKSTDTEEIKCKCGHTAHKIISAPYFKVEGYNADNLYSKEKPKKPKGDIK